MTTTSHPAVTVAARRTFGAVAYEALRTVRPRQWTKNVLVFAGLLFAGKVGDATAWGEAVIAFASYCALSGAAYVVNDIRDREDDRRHPVKRLRPLASGTLGTRPALLLAGLLAAGGLIADWSLGSRSLELAAGFVVLQSAYSGGLKRAPYVDLLAIAALFVIRASAGAAAVHVHASAWLLACTALLALFLGLAKRRAELVLVDAGRTPGRRALWGYSFAAVDRLLDATAAFAFLAYTAYAATAHDSRELLLTVPLVMFGVLRYRQLVHRDGLGEEPENVLLSDMPIVVTVIVWAALSAIVLGTS